MQKILKMLKEVDIYLFTIRNITVYCDNIIVCKCHNVENVKSFKRIFISHHNFIQNIEV